MSHLTPFMGSWMKWWLANSTRVKRRKTPRLWGLLGMSHSWLLRIEREQERQDTSRPSTIDTAPPHIVAEIQMMKEWTDFMMNALRGWVSSNLDDLVHQTDSPFTVSITSFPLPLKFRMPQVENYDGSKDPLDHLESFKTLMHIQGVSDEIMCRAFPATLKGPARI